MTLSLFSFSQSIQQALRFDTYEYPITIAWVINNISSLVLAVISISLLRRPDVTFQGRKVDRQRTVCGLHRYTWSWIEPLLRKASLKGDLDEEDIPQADYTLRSEQLQKKWDDMEPQGTLLRSLVWEYKERLGFSWIVTIVRCLVSILPFWIMLLTLDILENRETKGSHQLELLGLISGMAVFNLLDAVRFLTRPIYSNHINVILRVLQWIEGCLFWHSLSELSLPIRAQLSSLVFAKSMRLKDVRTANKDHDRSRQSIVNLVGVDTERIAYFMQFQFLIVNGIVKLVIFSVLLVQIIGWIPFTAGISAWLLVMPASTWFSNLLLVQSKKLMHLRDSKLIKINEVLLGLRQIKLCALEQRWEAKIIALRKMELRALWKYFIADSGLFGCWVFGHTLLAAVSLAVYVFVNGTLSPSVAFVSLGILGALECTLETLPELITLSIDTLVSISRVGTYLSRPNMQNETCQGCSISFRKATISWPLDYQSVDEGRFTLNDFDVSFPDGQLSVITGKTGSGKSLLISAILGEADLLEGYVCVPKAPVQNCYDIMHPENWITPGCLGYVSQTPWLENGSLRDNILFGLQLVKERYDQVIEACALKQDLAILADGDGTELGANGVNLSGGQKWRITLARAIYSRAEILVLEDIFCAVDTHVGRWILEKCINGSLCKGRTRILVTHNLGLVLSAATYVVELHGGTVAYAGCPQPETHKEVKNNTLAAPGTNEDSAKHIENVNDLQMGDLSAVQDSPRKFVLEERREVGIVKSSIYLTYLEHSGGILLWSICASLFLAYQISIVGKFEWTLYSSTYSDMWVGRAWWVRIWTSESISSEPSGSIIKTYSIVSPYLYNHHRPNKPTDQNVFFYLNIYIITSMAMVAIAITRYFWIYFLSIKASRTIFNKMLFTVLHAPLQWLEAMPTGQIINRFTADLNIVDQRTPLSWIMFFTNLLRLIGVCVACISTCSYVLAPAAVLLLLGILVGKRYLQASRPLKRLESVSKSPVFDLFNTTLAGISTIRASKKTQTYMARMHRYIDMWTMTTFYIWLANRWMSFRMALLAAAFCITVGLVIVFNSSIDAALAGFMLSFVLDFSESMRWTIRSYADMELDMNSMERIDEYMNVETESLSGACPPTSWPTLGAIQFCNLDVAYGPGMPLVLRGLTFDVRHNERVAIVGRTGAGKSSLTLALFRCLEIRGGSIIIDGLDISQLNLHCLRSHLAIIPQVSLNIYHMPKSNN
jgi:ABC-type multidrug transport system fused ATPase/permease subunit